MNSRIATVDIGTNTALLLIAEHNETELITIRQIEEIVRLGEGVDERRILQPAAIDRVISALKRYTELAQALKCQEMIVTGTSAVRDAANRQVLLDSIDSYFGIRMRILSGSEEAQLTYRGALSNKSLTGRNLLVDIGGGSTEFTVGTSFKIEKAVSLDIGSVRLTERFIRNDPIADIEFAALRSFVHRELDPLDHLREVDPVNLIGVAGTITTLAAMQLQLMVYEPERIDGCSLSAAQIARFVSVLRAVTVEERKMIPGLNPKRADVILAGAVILQEILDYFGFDNIEVSDRGLRYGVALQWFEERVNA